MKAFLFFALWFSLASVIDSALRMAQESLPDNWKWIRLNSLAFVVVLSIGMWLGAKYPQFLLFGVAQ